MGLRSVTTLVTNTLIGGRGVSSSAQGRSFKGSKLVPSSSAAQLGEVGYAGCAGQLPAGESP